MQGLKKFYLRLFYQTSLDSLVPKDNYYRNLDRHLDLHFLYSKTKKYYGREGQESIDPVVFFKILLVGYLNNTNSDRSLLRFCADSLSIRLFLGYDLDEDLPWHSTISRTRQLYGEEVFLSLFQEVLRKCICKGMVRGKRQCVDSVFIKANASMDSLLEKAVLSDVSVYVDELEENSFQIEEVIADAGYSSGDSLQYCADHSIDAWIPNFGQYKAHRSGFVFNAIADGYDCIQEGGNKAFLGFKGIRTDSKGYQKKTYRSSEKDCKDCPLREQCCGKVSKFKKLDESIHKPLYDKMHQKLTAHKAYHRRLVKRRSSTVEPVLGTLINYHSMKRVNS